MANIDSQLASCFEPVVDEVSIPVLVEEGQHLLGVGATILNEPVLSSGFSSAGNLDSCSRFLVQKTSMSLTEQVLLHRDA